MPNVHTIDAKRHQAFLSEQRVCAGTKEPLKAGDRIVLCARCKCAFFEDIWRFIGGKHCDQSDTLYEIPSASATSHKFTSTLGIDKPSALGSHNIFRVCYACGTGDYHLIVRSSQKTQNDLDILDKLFLEKPGSHYEFQCNRCKTHFSYKADHDIITSKHIVEADYNNYANRKFRYEHKMSWCRFMLFLNVCLCMFLLYNNRNSYNPNLTFTWISIVLLFGQMIHIFIYSFDEPKEPTR